MVPVMERLRERQGIHAALPVANGTDFTNRFVDQWAFQNLVAVHFIDCGKSTQSAFIESFNGKFRDECLSQNYSVDLCRARKVTGAWRVARSARTARSGI